MFPINIMRWAEAVKIWNQHKKSVNPDHIYALPKKGTPEHAHAKHIQMGGKPEDFGKEPKKFVINKPKPSLSIKAPVNEEELGEIAERIKKLTARRRLEKALLAHAEKKKMQAAPKKFVFKKKEISPRQAAQEMSYEEIADRAFKSTLKETILTNESLTSKIYQVFGGYSEKEADKIAERLVKKNKEEKEADKKTEEETSDSELESLTTPQLITIIKNWAAKNKRVFRGITASSRAYLIKLIKTNNMPIETKKSEALDERESLRRRIRAWAKENGLKISGIMNASVEVMKKLISERNIP